MKALKTVPASAAGAAARYAGWLVSAQDALERGVQAARAAMGQASQADPSVGAVVVPGEAADAAVAVALSPPDVSSVPALTSGAVVADSLAEPSTAPNIEMVGASPLAVVPDLPVPGPKEGANAVAEVGDQKPATLAEGKPSASMAMAPDVLTAGNLTPWRRSAQHRGPSQGAASSSLRSATPMSGVDRRSGSRATAPRNPSSSSTMSRRSSLGMSFASMPRR
jgi:hypothetical protein